MNWTGVQRMEISAALDKLVKTPKGGPIDLEAAATVISYGSQMSERGKSSSSITLKTWGNGTTGSTPEHGEMTVDDDKPRVSQYSVGEESFERVGQFKLERRANQIVFYHFWEADVETMGMDNESPTHYHLFYDLKTHEPVRLSFLAPVDVFPWVKKAIILAAVVAPLLWLPLIGITAIILLFLRLGTNIELIVYTQEEAIWERGKA